LFGDEDTDDPAIILVLLLEGFIMDCGRSFAVDAADWPPELLLKIDCWDMLGGSVGMGPPGFCKNVCGGGGGKVRDVEFLRIPTRGMLRMDVLLEGTLVEGIGGGGCWFCCWFKRPEMFCTDVLGMIIDVLLLLLGMMMEVLLEEGGMLFMMLLPELEKAFDGCWEEEEVEGLLLEDEEADPDTPCAWYML
jgi:hypothetical protein